MSWWKLRAMLDGAAPTDPLWTWPRRLAALAIFVGIVSISWLRTEGGWREYDHPSWAITLPDEERFAVTSGGFARSGLFPSVDLAGFDFVQLPGNWRDHRTARRNFRRSWCGALGIPSGPCYRMEPDASKVPQEIWQLRAQVCEARGRGTDCSAYFAELDQQFHADWVQERRASLASLHRNDFGKEDFRRAKFPNTTMPNADLYSTRLEGANFFRAYLEGVNFQLATLHDTFFANADLSLARFRYTWISDTTFREADLSEASFHYALLVSTSKEKIDFTDAILSATDFRGAALKNVNMSAAQIDSLTDLSMSFGDSTVSLPDGVTRPCQWSDEDLPVEEFLGRWRWWVSHADNEWNRYAEARWDHLPLFEPPQDDPIRACTWEKSVTRWSE